MYPVLSSLTSLFHSIQDLGFPCSPSLVGQRIAINGYMLNWVTRRLERQLFVIRQHVELPALQAALEIDHFQVTGQELYRVNAKYTSAVWLPAFLRRNSLTLA